MKDKGTGAEKLIWLAGRQSGRPNASLLAADDILAALTQRIGELEARVSEILAEVAPELPPVDAKPAGDITAPKADPGGTHKMNREARVAADDELTRASEERRTLANEMRLLREAIQEARGIQLPAGSGASPVETRIAPDLRTAIADEMRSLLTELLADFRARPVTTPPVADHVAATTEIVEDVVANAPILEPLVEDAAIASPPSGPLVTETAASIDAIESVIEHVDELERPAPSEPIVDEYVEDLRASRKVAWPNGVEAPAPQLAASNVDAYVEDLSAFDAISPTGALDAVDAPPEPALPSVDEYVLESPGAAEPLIDERLQALRGFVTPPTEVAQSSAPPAEPIEPIVDEYVFEPPVASEPIVDEVELMQPEAAPSSEIVESSASEAEPILDGFVLETLDAPEPVIDERVENLLQMGSPAVVEWSAPPAQPIEPIVEEFIEESQPESALPFETLDTSGTESAPVVEELQFSDSSEPIAPYFVPEPAAEAQILPPSLPSTPDARIDALWNAAASWSKVAEIEPPKSFEPAPFITEGAVPEIHSLEVPEAKADTWAEPVRETPTEFVPPPPMDFAPAPPTAFAPDTAAISEPAPPLQPLSLEAAPQPSFATMFPELRVADERGLQEIQVVISPIHSFPRLLETERRIRALSTVNALHLRDFRNGIATLTVSVGEAISPAEFGAVIQMLEELHLRLEGTTQSSVELRAEDEPPSP